MYYAVEYAPDNRPFGFPPAAVLNAHADLVWSFPTLQDAKAYAAKLNATHA